MLLIIILNATFSAFVLLAIVGLHIWAIHSSQAQQRAAARLDRPAVTVQSRTRQRRRALVGRPAI